MSEHTIPWTVYSRPVVGFSHTMKNLPEKVANALSMTKANDQNSNRGLSLITPNDGRAIGAELAAAARQNIALDGHLASTFLAYTLHLVAFGTEHPHRGRAFVGLAFDKDSTIRLKRDREALAESIGIPSRNPITNFIVSEFVGRSKAEELADSMNNDFVTANLVLTLGAVEPQAMSIQIRGAVNGNL